MFAETTVLITGGSGSFGQRFARRLLDDEGPRKVIIYSRDEWKQEEMRRAFDDDPRLRFFIGDVRDLRRLQRACHRVDYLVHAAALKQVPAAEYNPFEAVQTNILGAQHVIEAAIDNGIRRVVALSTDKAANPINLYGATKLCSDKLFVAGNSYAGGEGTRFAVVRYGNVSGSRGSVLPLFQECARLGRPIPITDARMTRFWITLDQGVDFVIASLERMKGGELFVPRIPSLRVTELAEAVAPGHPTEVVGIRPGEKLHELMIGEDDARRTLAFDGFYVVQPEFPWWGRDALEGGEPVADDFFYRSDRNDRWLDVKQLRRMMDTS